MNHSKPRTHVQVLAALTTGLALSACGGGGGSDGGLISGFGVENVNVEPNQVWQINRAIAIQFNRPVMPGSANFNTIKIQEASGAPAAGQFFLRGDRTVVWQPRCPLSTDFSDAGLRPGGVTYLLDVVSGSDGVTVRSVGGDLAVGNGRTVTFTTPASGQAIDLFLDPQAGPPVPKIWDSTTQTVAQQTGNSYVQVGEDPLDLSKRFFFDRGGSTVGTLPADLPLNFFSDGESQFTVVLEINQPVNPTAANINENRIRLEYEDPANGWTAQPTDVTLSANCAPSGDTLAGAQVQLRPRGILPQNRPMRVVVTSEFEDLIGQRNQVDLTGFTAMQTSVVDLQGFTPTDEGADEFKESFLVGGNHPGSFEDVDAVFSSPQADWGSGRLEAAFDFSGTGGPGGNFDWYIPAGQTFVLDTITTPILGGPGGVPTTTQVVVEGVVNVRDLFIPEGSELVVQGANPLTILASGTVTINGRLRADGGNNVGVMTLNTNFQPEAGAAGVAGGGRGGTGSFQTNQATAQGGPGDGAFGLTGGGGQGGESSYALGNVNNRRPGGGGGGGFGENMYILNNPNSDDPTDPTDPTDPFNFCPDQNLIGMDAEPGFDGSENGVSAVTDTSPAKGGLPGAGPFIDDDSVNDFWGTMVTNVNGPALTQSVVRGELLSPWAGSGGGGGGDNYRSEVFPTDPYQPFRDDKGAGGGGGGGSITILALGNIILGPNGFIEADGGVGGGGENTAGVNRTGGGSGGGSGGHIVLQTASRIDMSQVFAKNNFGINTIYPCNSNSAGCQGRPAPQVRALGGQGGAGRNETAGARAGGVATLPHVDGLHSTLWVGNNAPCFGPGNPAANRDVSPQNKEDVECTGGDGGPGVVQFHAPTLDDIIAPGGTVGAPNHANLLNSVYPRPVGLLAKKSGTTSTSEFVNRLVPIFGRFSQARTRWVQLGGVHADPNSATPKPLAFHFDGTDPATGLVRDDGSERVLDLPALLSGTLAAAPGVPSYDPTTMTVTMDASSLQGGADDIYIRNPNLLEGFAVQAGGMAKYDILDATFDVGTGVLSAVILDDGTAGDNLLVGAAVDLIPHFFRVSTFNTQDVMVNSSEIMIEFQATTATPQGTPDLVNVFPTPDTWTTDIADLNAAADNDSFQFFRYQVTFDIQADGGELSFDTPRPSLEFLRVPLRF